MSWVQNDQNRLLGAQALAVVASFPLTIKREMSESAFLRRVYSQDALWKRVLVRSSSLQFASADTTRDEAAFLCPDHG